MKTSIVFTHLFRVFFRLLLLTPGWAAAADVNMGVVNKMLYFEQTSPAEVVAAAGTNHAWFEVFVAGSAIGSVTGASIRLPDNVPSVALAARADGMGFGLEQGFATTSALNSAFPNGGYTFLLDCRNDGARSATVTLGGDVYPSTPRLSNYGAAQTINAAGDFTVTWDPFVGGTINDFVQFTVTDPNTDDTVFQSASSPGEPGALNGTSTSVVVPAGTLAAEATYEARLMFIKMSDVNMTSYPGAMFVGAFGMLTRCSVASAVSAAPDAVVAGLVKGQHYVQTDAATVAPGANYAEMSAYVVGRSPGSLVNASVLLPNYALLGLSPSGDANFDYYSNFVSLAALDAAFPNGQYVLRMEGAHDGFHGIPLSLVSNATPLYPVTPAILNHDAAQTIDPTADFVLSWGAFSNGTVNDFVQLTIRDPATETTIWQTPEAGLPGYLNGLATSVVIPADTLPTDVPLEGELAFARVASVDTNTYAGVQCFSAFYKRTTFAMAAHIILPPDVVRAVVRKGHHYQQTSATSVAPVTGGTAARFGAYLTASGNDAVASAQVLRPSFLIDTLVPNTPSHFTFVSNFASWAGLDQAYPNGQYVLLMMGVNDGYHPVPVYLTNDGYPNPPQALNFEAAQAIDPGSDFNLGWSAFLGGTTNDVVQVIVNQPGQSTPVWKTPDAGQPGCLNGLATSVTIPALTLAPGQGYTAQIIFARIVYQDAQTYPGVPCAAAYYTTTMLGVATAGQTDTEAPLLWEIDPGWNHQGVARNSGVAFTFNEAMRPGHSIAWLGATNAFAYAWSPDRKVLFCTPQGLLPANATVGYVLNPSSEAPGFFDLAGNALGMDVYGEFQTGNAVTGPDVKDYSVHKEIDYVQIDAVTVVLETNAPPYMIGADVQLNVAAGVTNASVRHESGSEQPLPYDEGFEWEASYASSNLLEAAYPGGSYTFTLATVHDGPRSVTLDLSGDHYPVPPRVSNWAGAQAIDPSTDFTLTWESFSNALPDAMISLWVRAIFAGGDEDVLATPDPGQPGALGPGATAFTIPAGTLSPGRKYMATLMFVNLTDRDMAAYPGAMGLSGYAVLTRFAMGCIGTPIVPRVECLGTEGGYFRLRVSGEPGIPYTVEAKDSLQPGPWMRLTSERTSSGVFECTDWQPMWTRASRFYRVREGW